MICFIFLDIIADERAGGQAADGRTGGRANRRRVVVVVVIVIRSFLDQVFLPGRLVGLVMRDRPHAPPLPRFGYTKGELRKLAGVACGLFLDIHRSRCRGGVTLDPQSPPANKLADAD